MRVLLGRMIYGPQKTTGGRSDRGLYSPHHRPSDVPSIRMRVLLGRMIYGPQKTVGWTSARGVYSPHHRSVSTGRHEKRSEHVPGMGQWLLETPEVLRDIEVV